MILLVVARSQIALLQFEKSRERGPNAGRQRTRSRSGSGGSNAGPSLYANPAHTRHETPPRQSTGAPLQTFPGVRPMRHRPSGRERSVVRGPVGILCRLLVVSKRDCCWRVIC